VIRREALENLIERNPDLGAGYRVDRLTQIFRQRLEEIVEGNLDVASGKLWIDGRERQHNPRIGRGKLPGPQDRRRQKPKDRQHTQ
jgi:hypothetical protein